MSIENGKAFEYSFWISWDQKTPKDDWEKMEEWCNESCAGQWMVITASDAGSRSWGNDYIMINSYSRAAHSSPIPDENYPASRIKKNAAKILMFETLEDATAFKLRWVE